MLSGRGMGGGSGAPGGMLRVVGIAAARAGVTSGGLQSEPVSSPVTQNSTTRPAQKSKSSNLASSSSPFPSNGVHLSGPLSKQGVYWCDEEEWVIVAGIEDERGHGVVDDSNLWSVPSKDEVEDAVFALKNFHSAPYDQYVRDKHNYSLVEDYVSNQHNNLSSDGLEIDWKEPCWHVSNPRTWSSHVPEKVHEAFYLLRTEPSVQKMVKSLSSDEAVWKAVLNNDIVRELKESFYAEKSKISQDSTEASSNDPDDDSDQVANFLIWAFDNTKTKVMEAIEKVTSFMMKIFMEDDHKKGSGPDAKNDDFEVKLRTSFLLSILVLVVVVVSRAHA